MKKSNLEKYASKAKEINGWFWAEKPFTRIDRYHGRKGIKGNIFEIGAYEGKSAILLGSMLRGKEHLGICDLFEKQINPYTSKGSSDKFMDNMKGFFDNLDFLRVYNKSSVSLKMSDIGENYRFFHIDGNHDMEHTLNDITLADLVVNQEGVIAIDDYFNSKKPGVSKGVVEYFLGKPDLSPFAIGFNKVLFCRNSMLKNYESCILNKRAEFHQDIFNPDRNPLRVEFLGNPTIVLRDN